MRKLWILFLVIGLLGAERTLGQPQVRTSDAQGDAVAAILRQGGFHAGDRQADDAMDVLRFASGGCEIRVVPVGFLFQEMALLKQVGAPGDGRRFRYDDQSWDGFMPAAMTAAHVKQSLLRMIGRSSPNSGTMLYVVAPQNCPGLGAIRWAEFWRPQAL